MIVLVIFLVGASLISKGKLLPKKLVLSEENGSGEGFVSGDGEGALPGQTGRAVTVLRPAGIAEIGGRRLDVVTRGDFIPEGAALRVEAVEGSRIVVGLAE